MNNVKSINSSYLDIYSGFIDFLACATIEIVKKRREDKNWDMFTNWMFALNARLGYSAVKKIYTIIQTISESKNIPDIGSDQNKGYMPIPNNAAITRMMISNVNLPKNVLADGIGTALFLNQEKSTSSISKIIENIRLAEEIYNELVKHYPIENPKIKEALEYLFDELVEGKTIYK